MSKIFINYRREDSAGYAIGLYDRLVSHFGQDAIFRDIDQIEPGEDFVEVIQQKLEVVQVAVVLIGKHWLDSTDAAGQRRLDNPDDFVRLEIATLLERGIRVIPVLVGGATVPKSSQLPECLVPLARRNAYEISDLRFRTDVDKLIQVLEKVMGVPTPPQPMQPEPPKIPEEPEKLGHIQYAMIAGVAGIVLAAGLYLGGMLPKPAQILPKLEDPVIEPIAAIASTETKSTSTNKPTTEQLQPAVSEPITQPVAERPKITLIEPEMVRIPSGKFLMGSPGTEEGRTSNEGPQHEVTIAYAFEMSKHEVTFDEYDAFAKATKRDLPDDRGWGRGRRPVINVTFSDAQAYVQWLSDQTGKQYRLPTEAEWEYAARAGTQTFYWWGDDIGRNNAVCDGCDSQLNKKQTVPVGSFKANAFGLHDTVGNATEWVQDCRHDHYHNAPSDGSAWMEADSGDCANRIKRGGSWNNIPREVRSAVRLNTGNTGGFRIVRAL